MKYAWLLALLGCGPPAAPSLRFDVAESAAVTFAQCPTLPANIPVQARVLINNDTVHPCLLTVAVAATSGAYSVTGQCKDIPAQATVDLTLQWYVVGPTSGNFVLLAESIGTLKIPGDKQTYTAAFTSVKTKGAGADDDAERNRFNCDRTGVSTCDSASSAAVVQQDVDNCSNLEELCLNTLFDAQSFSTACP